MGQLHYNVHDLEANKKFWVALGAKPVTIGKMEALRFPGLLIVLTQADSSGGTEGSIVNHIGFRVPNVPQFLAKMKTAGYKVEPSQNGDGVVGNVYTPEGERIELLQDGTEHVEFVADSGKPMRGQNITAPITLHHIHFYVPEGSVSEAKAWYIRFSSGIPGKRWHYEAVDLPGVNLNFSESPDKMAPTKGRQLDYIGFEVKNLEAFCKQLQANGVRFDAPYKKLPTGIAIAFLTDPWGTSIELTEGMNSL